MLMRNRSQRFNIAALPLLMNNARSLFRQSVDYATGYRVKLYFPYVVFPKYRLMFLAVPRSGTTSVRYALTPLLGGGLDFSLPEYRNTFRHYLRSCTRREAATKYADCFKFTFVRNPWTRLYSCYLAKVWSKSNRHFRHLGLDQCRTFEDFVMRACDIPDRYADPHIMSQDQILTYRGQFLPDCVYRFENYTQDWAKARGRIEERTGVKLTPIPHYYRMESQEYREAYTERLVDLVAERYRADCRRFGYSYPG